MLQHIGGPFGAAGLGQRVQRLAPFGGFDGVGIRDLWRRGAGLGVAHGVVSYLHPCY
ncbi:Uncharacterised protein [Bordetella pertussis]|nr:Uncharacterised protein [Bordetella pertussis]